MSKSNNDINFEKAIEELELIVNKLENGNLALEESLEQFQRGIELYNYCNKLLQDAETKIRIITQDKNGNYVEANFDNEE